MDAISVSAVRGRVVESRHRVHAVAVRDSEVLDAVGDPRLVTFMRSAAKPLQALPLALEHPDLGEEEVAIACASHEALPEQLAAVRSLLARAGAREDDLECGPVEGSKLRHNCSGKHAGMLLRARAHGWAADGYRLPEHPLQQGLLALVADAAGVAVSEVETATDGCGVVAFALPLWRLAFTFSRLVRAQLPGSAPIVSVMRAHPDLIGGPGAVDSRLMREVPGAIAKRGAEGVLCVGLAEGTGVALKVEDGSARAVGPAAARFLGIPALQEAPLVNSRGDEVGRVVG
ncbi:MAG: asparaginase [Actinomycetota bacterium]|nr:asparaginase [Actinomycetota bacterium]